ncbi:MAG: hypothetical protein JRI68_19910 [Deltaproteobacteria bacterium]|nr:hypothetical protein [Deltaproteobacteria bacterium]
MKRCWTALPWAAALALLYAGPVQGGEPQGSVPAEVDGSGPARDKPLDPDYWGPSRFFLAGENDLGFLYVRPRLSAGYGQPFRKWVGVDANPILSLDGPGIYSGLRAKVPFLDLRVGGRFRTAFERSFLVPQYRYDTEKIESREGPDSRYWSWEAQLTGSIPAGPGAVLAELTGTAVTLVDEGYFVFEETVRAVIDPPWALRGRLGYSLRFIDERLSVAPVVEVLYLAGRHTTMFRGGLLTSFRVDETLAVRAIAVPTLASRDKLGAEGADTFLAGVRWRWATGDLPGASDEGK